MKSRENHGKFAKTGLDKRNISKCQKGKEQGVGKGKYSKLSCHTRCKYSIETTRNSVKVKLGMKVIEIGEKSDRLRLREGDVSTITFPE